tara:strand:+ start:421 stop:765 length:345 start_codon:yes stop_codon:yes gene_type:complete
MKIYHNPRCSKSREVLEIIKNNTSGFEIIEYMKYPLTFEEISVLLSKLKINPLQLVRKKEKLWQEKFKNKEMTNNSIIDAMAKHPKLIERPIIIINNKKAIVGRPIERVLNLFD